MGFLFDLWTAGRGLKRNRSLQERLKDVALIQNRDRTVYGLHHAAWLRWRQSGRRDQRVAIMEAADAMLLWVETQPDAQAAITEIAYLDQPLAVYCAVKIISSSWPGEAINRVSGQYRDLAYKSLDAAERWSLEPFCDDAMFQAFDGKWKETKRARVELEAMERMVGEERGEESPAYRLAIAARMAMGSIEKVLLAIRTSIYDAMSREPNEKPELRSAASACVDAITLITYAQQIERMSRDMTVKEVSLQAVRDDLRRSKQTLSLAIQQYVTDFFKLKDQRYSTTYWWYLMIDTV